MILNNLEQLDDPLSKTDGKFFQYMEVAERTSFKQSGAGDFTAFLLSLLDYNHGERLLLTKKEMPFYMARQLVDAKADVVLMDGNFYLLLVKDEKVNFSTSFSTMASFS